jgi:hypothetical protein
VLVVQYLAVRPKAIWHMLQDNPSAEAPGLRAVTGPLAWRALAFTSTNEDCEGAEGEEG